MKKAGKFIAKRGSLLLVGILLILILTGSYVSVTGYVVIIDNNVDADSDVDTTANIGTDGATSFVDAQTLDGTDQVITEAQGSSYVAGNNIEEFVDTNVDTQSPTDLGSHTSFAELQDFDSAYDTMTEAQGSGYVAANDIQDFMDAVTNTQDPADLGIIGDWTELQDSDSVTTTLTEADAGGSGGTLEYSPTAFTDSVPDVTDDTYAYDSVLSTYAYQIIGADRYPAFAVHTWETGTGTITNVDLVVRFACADSGNDQFGMYWKVGSSADQTCWALADQAKTLDNYTFSALAEPNDASWSWTDIGNFNLFWNTEKLQGGETDQLQYYEVVLKVTTSAESNYRFDREFSFTSLDTDETNEYLCIKTGTIGTETLDIDVWHSSAWTDIGTDIVDANDDTWINISITTWLDSATEYFRFEDAITTSDTGSNTWQIDCILIHSWTDATDDYELELEFAFGTLDHDETNEELCIKTGTIGDEDLDILVWTGVWTDIGTNILTTNDGVWINISITTWLDATDEYFLFRDTSQANEGSQSTWLLDCVLIHSWSEAVDDYELAWEHQVQSVDTHKDYYVLTIFGQATGGDSETFSIELWNSSSTTWHDTLQDISISETWHNWTITSGYSDCLGATITYRFIGNSESGDSTQSILNIDYSGIRAYNFSIYDNDDHTMPDFSPDNLYYQFATFPMVITVESGCIYDVNVLGVDIAGDSIANGWIYWNSVDNSGTAILLTTSWQTIYSSQAIGTNNHNIYLWVNCGWIVGDPALTNVLRSYTLNVSITIT